MRIPKPVLALLAIAMLALVAGCGSSSDSTSSSTTTSSSATDATATDSTTTDAAALSLDEYGKAVSDEFSSFNTDFTSLGQQAASPKSKSDYLNTVDQLQARVGQTISTLQGLGAPSEAQQFNDDAITALQDLQSSFDPIKVAVQSNDQTAVQKAAADLQTAAAAFQQKFVDLDQEAKDAGIPINNLVAPSGG